jgi:hypothetical protein
MSLHVAISEAKSFADLRGLVDRVECHLTFWGNRYITLTNFEGIEPIDVLAARVIELVNQYKFKFTDNERLHGKAIAKKITQLYDISDAQVDHSWFLTRIFVFFRNLPNVIPGLLECPARNCSKIRWYWKDFDHSSPSTYSDVFEFYTRDQYYFFWHFGRIPAETLRFTYPEHEKAIQRVDAWWKPEDHNTL